MDTSGSELSANGDHAEQCLIHKVSKNDNLAGIAVKYGISVSDIKKANGLLSDNGMFAKDTLLIPLDQRGARCSFADGSTFARFVGGLGKRADQPGMVSQPGTTAIGPVANGPRSLVDCIKTPTSPTESSMSEMADQAWRDVGEVEMKVLSETVMTSKRKDEYTCRNSLRRRCVSARFRDRPGSCSPRMEHREMCEHSTCDRPCSCSPTLSGNLDETLQDGDSTSARSARKTRSLRPPNLPNGKKSSQLKGYIVSVAHSVVEQYNSARRFCNDGAKINGRNSETFFQRVKRVANQRTLRSGSPVNLSLVTDSFISSLSSFSHRASSYRRRWSEPGSPAHPSSPLPNNGGLKSE